MRPGYAKPLAVRAARPQQAASARPSDMSRVAHGQTAVQGVSNYITISGVSTEIIYEEQYIDGGGAWSVYLTDQYWYGGNASGN